MADHPLRPATDRRLGRPLPHQLPNPTRAPPAAINLSPELPPGVCGISRSFPRLSPTTGQVPTRYSPVRHSVPAETGTAFDLHVLGMPPAFVLSQDQTLKFIPGRACFRLLDPTRASKRSHRCTNIWRPQPALRRSDRRPRIPSLCSQSQTAPGSNAGTSQSAPVRFRPHPRRGSAYNPAPLPVSTRFAHLKRASLRNPSTRRQSPARNA